jgi:hypothetical protein
LRKEAALVINNFVITFCHDNKIRQGLLPSVDDSFSDMDVNLINDTKVGELFLIFEHCGFFERLKDTLESGKSIIVYCCAISELLLNLFTISPVVLHQKISESGSWPVILQYLQIPNFSANSLNPIVETYAQTQFYGCHNNHINTLRISVLNMVRLSLSEVPKSALYFIESTSLLSDLKRILMSDNFNSETQKDKSSNIFTPSCALLSISLITLSGLLWDSSQSDNFDLLKYFSSDDFGVILFRVCSLFLHDKYNNTTYQRSSCLCLSRIFSLHYGEFYYLSLEEKLNNPVDSKFNILGVEITDCLINIALSNFDFTDPVYVESVCLSLQCLLGRCDFAKQHAISINLVEKLVTWASSILSEANVRNLFTGFIIFIGFCYCRQNSFLLKNRFSISYLAY